MLVTWWGHSSVTVQSAGQRLLFDPVLGNSIAHLRRRRGPTPASSALHASAVFISHLHPDHCHLPSLRMLDPEMLVVGPRGLSDFLRRSGRGRSLRCHELVPGQETAVGDLTVRALYAEHGARRTAVSRVRAQPLSFLVAGDPSGAAPLWFGGDTALHPEIAQVAPVSVALVPVAGWGPTLGPGHLDAEQAAEAVRRLSAEIAIPIHYGTFWPRGLDWLARDQFLGPQDRFEHSVGRLAPHTTVRIMQPGETLDTSPGRLDA